GRLAQAVVDGGRRFGGGCVPDAGGHPCQPDGVGARRGPLWRLLEARPAAARPLRRWRSSARSGLLGVLRISMRSGGAAGFAEPALVGEDDGLAAVAEVELGEDAADVGFDCF